MDGETGLSGWERPMTSSGRLWAGDDDDDDDEMVLIFSSDTHGLTRYTM